VTTCVQVRRAPKATITTQLRLSASFLARRSGPKTQRHRRPLTSSVFQQTPPWKRGPSTKEDLKQTLRSSSQRFIASLRVPLARAQSRAAEAFFNSNSSSPMRASDTDNDLASVRMEFKRSWAWAGFTRNSSTIDERPTILMIFSGLSMS
jgi:hypothetical protein